MAKKGSSKHKQEEYKRYQNEDRFLKNKIRRLKRHCKRFPDDAQSAEALKDNNHAYVRNNFKHNKPENKIIRLKDLPRDERKSMSEQIKRMVDSGELVVRKS